MSTFSAVRWRLLQEDSGEGVHDLARRPLRGRNRGETGEFVRRYARLDHLGSSGRFLGHGGKDRREGGWRTRGRTALMENVYYVFPYPAIATHRFGAMASEWHCAMSSCWLSGIEAGRHRNLRTIARIAR